ncbi:MAG: Uma2 family endonuclease [Gemmatimonadales bacterium]
MPVVLRRFTVEEVDALPDDGNRHEVLDGILFVTPAPGPPHQTVAARLFLLLGQHLAAGSRGQIWSPGVVPIDRRSRLEPDLLIGVPPKAWSKWSDLTERWLAVEVSGPGSRLYDRTYKRSAYLDAGVQEVWLVDLARREVTLSRPGAADQVVTEHLDWREPNTGLMLSIDLEAVFRDVTLSD